MGVQNQIYAHKIKLVGGTKRVVEKSRILRKITLRIYRNRFLGNEKNQLNCE